MNDDMRIVTVNVGSSSIKLAVFAADNPERKLLEAAVENIGTPVAHLVTDGQTQPITASSHVAAANTLLVWLTAQASDTGVIAIGHRIVHGGPKYYQPQIITDELLADLDTFAAFAPEHLPIEVQLVKTFRELLPDTVQVACFDTAFHHDLPTPAQLLPLPRHLTNAGVRRYGFHGLSYTFILEELRRVEGDAAANGKVVIAHLGSGTSLAAVQGGKPVDTTMGMTPTSGIPMSTRSGDLDPGVALYLARTQDYGIERFSHMVNFESGLLGISETTADMKKLLEIEDADQRAKDAVDLFCYQIKKSIGGLAAALGGLNTLIFTGGMGERAPEIRARICDGLAFLGVALDPAQNEQSARLISASDSPVGVHVIHTDEAVTIARETAKIIERQ